MASLQNQAHWEVLWRDRQGREQVLPFELGCGFCYRVVIGDERDDEAFLRIFLRPPETALLLADGGLLSNLNVDENLLLPLSYRGVDTRQCDARVLELFSMCGMAETEIIALLARLPHQLSLYQKRAVGFVRALLLNPKAIVYASVWHSVSQAERIQIQMFDAILRRVLPACTRVFLDYDTQMDDAIELHQTFYLRE